MNEKKLQFIDLLNDRLDQKDFENLCMDEDEIKQYENGERDPFIIFEGDPDYMVTPKWNVIYFCIIDSTVYYLSMFDNQEDLDKLMEFCAAQNPKISPSWYNTRSESKNREYFEDENDNRDGFENYNWLKIAYRGWCWYVYTLFKYVN